MNQETVNVENLLNVIVQTGSGESKSLEAPAEMLGQDFITDLLNYLQQPTINSDGHAINWRVDNKETGLTLALDKTLAENNVQSGHHLMLNRDAIPG